MIEISPKRKNSEFKLQCAFINFIKWEFPEIDILCFAIPNGGSRHPAEAVNFKKMGVKAGVCDMFIALPNKMYHGLFIEFKSKRGKLTDNQKKFIEHVENKGYFVSIINDIDMGMDMFRNYVRYV